MNNPRNAAVWALALGAIWLLSGCKRSYDLAAAQTGEIRAEVDSLAAGQRQIKSAVRGIERALEAEMGALRRTRADDTVTYVGINERMNALEAKLDDHIFRLERFMERWEKNFATAGGGTGAVDSLKPDSSGASSSGPAGSDGQALYDGAYLDLTRGDYDLAEMGFRDFLQANPESELADNACYWIGECHYAQEQYLEALARFRQVTEEFPGADKVPAAMLKMGLTYMQLGEGDKAEESFERLAAEYPYSEEAAAARARLQDNG